MLNGSAGRGGRRGICVRIGMPCPDCRTGFSSGGPIGDDGQSGENGSRKEKAMPRRGDRVTTIVQMLVVLVSACSVSAFSVSSLGETWPQWRGVDGQGHAPAAHDLPLTWSETEHVVWKTPLPGRGWSSPVLDERLVWMTTAVEQPTSDAERARRIAGKNNPGSLSVSGPVTFKALAVEREGGRLVHEIDLFTVDDPQPIHSLNSYASPSPVLAGDRLWCHFGDNGTACVDTTSGRIVWQHRLLRLDHMNGAGSTPVLWRDLLLVHCDGSDVQSIVALDAATGAIRWRTPRSGTLRDNPDLKKAYGTPLVVEWEGRDTVLSPAADWLYAYDPETGRELWKLDYGVLGFSIVPRPVVADGLVFLSTSFMQPELLAVRLDPAGGPPRIAWREKRGAPTMASPLVVGEELYMVSDKGITTCLDTRTGAVVWSERLGGNFSSSPLHADGRIYVGNRDGATFVIRPGRTFELLATNQLDGRIFASPAAVDRALYLRTDEALYRLELPERPAAGAATADRR